MSGVLDGIRVLDFGRYIAGPCCATLLGDFGADVIRIERVDGSEDRFTTPVTENGEGATFLQLGRNKKGFTLNPMKPEGREVLDKLVATADVIVANLPKPTLEPMGLDYDRLCTIKPDIILVTPSAFGPDGPYSHRVGFDGVAQAMSGNMHLTGEADRPIKSWTPYVDFGTAMLSAFGTMAALMERQKTGRGQKVEGCLLATAMFMNNAHILEQGAIAPDRVGSVNRSQNSGPADTFATQDGWILIHIVGKPLFERWTNLMGENSWLDDDRFDGDQNRGDNNEALSERMGAWCAERTTDEALAALDTARIPAGRVYTPQEVLDDIHVQEVGFLKPMDYPGVIGRAMVAETPVRLSATPGTVRERAPTLGEHTDAILADLGYDADAIAALHDKRAV
jgi:crotonobetainyl-CoA:carnitine CoA-transferase CaiB-like acyl-CoA transferase